MADDIEFSSDSESQKALHKRKKSWFNIIPDAILVCILDFADTRDLVMFSRVCKRWGEASKFAKRWWLSSMTCLQSLEGHKGSASCLALINSSLVASGSQDNTIRIWNLQTGDCMRILQGHTGYVWSLVVAKGNLYSSSYDRTIRCWDINSWECMRVMVGHTASVWTLAVCLSVNKLFSGSLDTTIRCWDLDTGNCLQQLIGHEHNISAMTVYEPSEAREAESTRELKNECIQANTKEVLETEESKEQIGLDQTEMNLEKERGPMMSSLMNEITVSTPSSKRQSSLNNSLDEQPKFTNTFCHGIDTERGEQKTEMPIASIDCIDKPLLISGSYDCTIIVWDANSHNRLFTLGGHGNGIRALLVHGTKLYSGARDYAIRVWDLKKRVCERLLTEHTGYVRCLARHDNILFSGSRDKTIRAWNIHTWECERVLKGHAEYIRALLILEKERRTLLFSGSRDNSVKIWGTPQNNQHVQYLSI